VNGTRELVLGRVRAALGVTPGATADMGPSVTPSAARTGGAAVGRDAGATPARVLEPESSRPTSALVDLFVSRLVDYGAAVRRIERHVIGASGDEVFAELGVRRVGVPARLPVAWRPREATVVPDDGLSVADLDDLDAALTGCTCGIAETGTLLLTSSALDGRRALTLVPDVHVCVVEERQVVADLGAALVAVAPLVRDERRPLTFVSGPSATSDIELQRVVGVHGPRRLVVLLVAG